MKVCIIALAMLELLGGCAKKPIAGVIPDRHSWFIESWENGVFTVQNEDYTYRATCDGTTFIDPDKENLADSVRSSANCELAIGLVGHNIQPFGREQKDDNGWTVTMWNVGNALALRRWRDHTPWEQERFTITSVTKTLH
jgi:hypothetical protein